MFYDCRCKYNKKTFMNIKNVETHYRASLLRSKV